MFRRNRSHAGKTVWPYPEEGEDKLPIQVMTWQPVGRKKRKGS